MFRTTVGCGDVKKVSLFCFLDSQQLIDPELGTVVGQLNIKLLVASVHNYL